MHSRAFYIDYCTVQSVLDITAFSGKNTRMHNDVHCISEHGFEMFEHWSEKGEMFVKRPDAFSSCRKTETFK